LYNILWSIDLLPIKTKAYCLNGCPCVKILETVPVVETFILGNIIGPGADAVPKSVEAGVPSAIVPGMLLSTVIFT
jgi:hypothetical protein